MQLMQTKLSKVGNATALILKRRSYFKQPLEVIKFSTYRLSRYIIGQLLKDRLPKGKVCSNSGVLDE